jgi:hypothetical protein
MRVAALGRAILDGLALGGVIGVVKHMPGQGRATVDTHHDLPHVTESAAELEQDLAPFRALNTAAMGMTGHVVYDVWDNAHTATMSRFVIDEVIQVANLLEGFKTSINKNEKPKSLDQIKRHLLEARQFDRVVRDRMLQLLRLARINNDRERRKQNHYQLYGRIKDFTNKTTIVKIPGFKV